MDFKVGDEVRIKPGGSSYYAKANPGLVSKIRNIKANGFTSNVINLESAGSSGVWDYEIELVVPANVSYNSSSGVSPYGKLPSGYKANYSSVGNDVGYYDWMNEPMPEEKKPEIACECGQRSTARNKEEDAPHWHRDYCPVYRKEDK